MKKYRTDYKTRTKIVKVTMPMDVFAKLQRQANTEGSKAATLARAFIESGLDREARIPSGIQAELNAFRFLVRNISNNINQIAHHSNTVKHVANERGLFQWLQALESHVLDYTSERLK